MSSCLLIERSEKRRKDVIYTCFMLRLLLELQLPLHSPKASSYRLIGLCELPIVWSCPLLGAACGSVSEHCTCDRYIAGSNPVAGSVMSTYAYLVYVSELYVTLKVSARYEMHLGLVSLT